MQNCFLVKLVKLEVEFPMAPKLSRLAGVKRTEKLEILQSYREARERTRLKKDALEAVALEYGFSPNKVRMLLRRYNPDREGVMPMQFAHYRPRGRGCWSHPWYG